MLLVKKGQIRTGASLPLLGNARRKNFFYRDPFLGLWKDHRTRCHSYYVKKILYTNKEIVLTCIATCTASILHYVLHLHCSRTERGQREGGRGQNNLHKICKLLPILLPPCTPFLNLRNIFFVDYSISSTYMWFKSTYMWFKSRQWVNLISCSWMSKPLLLYLNAWQKPKMF